MSRISVFLITVALIAVMVGCVPAQYNLTVSSTEGGEVTTPSDGTFAYYEDEVVNLVAVAEEGYRFVGWTGDVGTVANVNSASTTITMDDQYSVTANFALGIAVQDWYDLDAMRNKSGGTYILMNGLNSTTVGYTELASPTANGGKGWQPIGTFSGSFDGQGYEIRDLFINRPDEDLVGLFRLVGEKGVIKNVGVVSATVTGKGAVGGLMGQNDGTVSNSYATGNVTGEEPYVGGLVGRNYNTVSDSCATGSVTSDDVCVGGLVGDNRGAVSNSYATGSVTGDESVGGLAGHNAGTVSNSYSTGSVTGDHSVGGLVGSNGGIDNNGRICRGTVSNSYSTGSVTGGYAVGGLIGVMSYGTISNSFWDIETSGTATSDGGTGKTTTEMKSIATLSGIGWNIVTVANPNVRNPSYIWNIVDEQAYPFLSWQSVS